MKPRFAIKGDWICCGLLCLAITAIYLPHIDGEFLAWDDDRFIVDNPHVSSVSIENVKWAVSGVRFESYQPLHMLSYMVDGVLWSGQPAGYRFHSLLLFIGAVLLLYFLLRKLKFSPVVSLAGACLFAVAPSRVESVAWIATRKDVLSLLLSLAAWHVHIENGRTRAAHITFKTLELLLFICALLSKSAAFVLPWMLFVFDCFWHGMPAGRALRKNAPLLLLSLFVAVFLPLLWADSHLLNINVPDGLQPRIGLVFWSLAHYVKTVLCPFSLSPLYAGPDETVLQTAFRVGLSVSIVSVGALIGVSIGGIAAAIKSRALSGKMVALFLASGIAIAPFLNIVPMYYLVADRYLLFIYIVIAITCCLALERLSTIQNVKYGRIGFSLVFLVCVAHGMLSYDYAARWKNSEILFETAVHRQPDSFWASMKYGEVLRLSKKFSLAEQAYRQAREIRPLSPSALGGVFWSAYEQDRIARNRTVNDGEEVTAYFMTNASELTKIRRLERRLRRAGFNRSADVVLERQNQMTGQ